MSNSIRPVLASTSTQAAITPTLPSQITSTTPNVEALAINFRPSPFYEFEATIMQPLLCNCKSSDALEVGPDLYK